MIKRCIFWMIFVASGSAWGEVTCSDIHDKQKFPSLQVESGIVCFVQKSILDGNTGARTGLEGISLYYIANGKEPVEAEGRGLPYDDTPGEIIDAFSLRLGADHREKIFVIHSFEVRSSLAEPNSSGNFYSVSVFEPAQSILRQDERSTDWFGVGYSWLSDGKSVIYKFPYQSRKDVQLALNSRFASLMDADSSISVKIKAKTYLFDEPSVRGKTKKYLIKGDRAVVERVTAGWCKINYGRGGKSVRVWLMCSSLDVDT